MPELPLSHKTAPNTLSVMCPFNTFPGLRWFLPLPSPAFQTCQFCLFPLSLLFCLARAAHRELKHTSDRSLVAGAFISFFTPFYYFVLIFKNFIHSLRILCNLFRSSSPSFSQIHPLSPSTQFCVSFPPIQYQFVLPTILRGLALHWRLVNLAGPQS